MNKKMIIKFHPKIYPLHQSSLKIVLFILKTKKIILTLTQAKGNQPSPVTTGHFSIYYIIIESENVKSVQDKLNCLRLFRFSPYVDRIKGT